MHADRLAAPLAYPVDLTEPRAETFELRLPWSAEEARRAFLEKRAPAFRGR